MVSTSLTILAVVAVAALATAQYPYVLFNAGHPNYFVQPGHIAPHAAFRQGVVGHPAVGYAMMPMALQPSEVNPAFVAPAIAPGSEKKFGATIHKTVTETVVSGTVSTTTRYTTG